MSDDLERAAEMVRRQSGGDQSFVMDIDRRRAAAILLSFLDMDEAGVERIARALWLDAFGELVGAARCEFLWTSAEADGERDPTMLSAIQSARAVLTELRKMASPTQRDEGE